MRLYCFIALPRPLLIDIYIYIYIYLMLYLKLILYVCYVASCVLYKKID
jgi:hypothetical protein